ncbi:MAG: glycosyltransferase family 87 protein [Candidatus Solibacter sp.]|nr:glycosyltransferase family 87 protein [Candidatus Solibacter sp.]
MIAWFFSNLCARLEVTLNYRIRLQRFVVPSACAVGALLNIWLACTVFLPGAWQGRNDFLGLYAGARLVGGPDLYDHDAVRNVHLQSIGETGEIPFVRPPCYALFLRPLGLLPYRTAYAVWATLLAAALAGFTALWPGASSSARWLICCWSLPAFVSLFNGQDVLLLLLWTALAACLVRAGKPAAAGMVLTLCASKFHLVALVPIVILAQRRWRMAGGVAVGGCVLLALSFAAAGRSWPLRYYAVLTDGRINPSVDHMPNLHSLLGVGRFGLPLQIAAGLVLAVGLFLVARSTSDFAGPLALALVAGVLVGFHGYLSDAALLLPALIAFSTADYARLPALALITPVPWFLLHLPRPLPALTQLLIVTLAAAGFMWIWKRNKESPPVRSG